MVSLTYLNLATADNERRCELLMKQYIGFNRSVRLLQRMGGVGKFLVKVINFIVSCDFSKFSGVVSIVFNLFLGDLVTQICIRLKIGR